MGCDRPFEEARSASRVSEKPQQALNFLKWQLLRCLPRRRYHSCPPYTSSLYIGMLPKIGLFSTPFQSPCATQQATSDQSSGLSCIHSSFSSSKTDHVVHSIYNGSQIKIGRASC